MAGNKKGSQQTIMITTMVTIIMQVKSKFVPVSKQHTKAYRKKRS